MIVTPEPSAPHALRDATVDELDTITVVADRLDKASDRGMDEEHTAHQLPPGRLDLGQAMQADAQSQMGVARTATPWRRMERRTLRAPALRLGIIVDRSPSMDAVIDAACAAAWVIAKAADRSRHARNTVEVAAFDADASLLDVDSVTQVPVAECTVPGAARHSAGLPDAVDLLRSRLQLEYFPDDSRLLVVLSDSALEGVEHIARTVTELTAAGVRVLWICLDEQVPDLPEFLPAQVTVIGADPSTLAKSLPDAVTAVLADTRGPGGWQ